MRKSTEALSNWKLGRQQGEELCFEYCKGGYFSTEEEYGLKVVGKMDQKKLSGKNLLNPQIVSQNNMSEAILDPDNNTYTLKGNVGSSETLYNTGQLMFPYGNAETYATSAIPVKQNTYYTISFDYLLIEQGVYSSKIQFNVLTSGLKSEGIFYVSGEVGVTKTVSFKVLTTTTGLGLIFRINNNYVTISNIQIEEGETATSYEPYCGGIQSPNPEFPQPVQCVKAGTEIKVRGKNLLEVTLVNTTSLGLTFTNNNDGSVTVNGNQTGYVEVRLGTVNVTPGVTYKMSVISFATNLRYVFKYKDANNALIENITVSAERQFVTTAPENAVTVDICIKRNTNNVAIGNYTFYPQFEVGDTSTDFESYFDGGTVITPCDLYEGDIWYPMSGKVIHNKWKYIFTGDEIWTKESGGNMPTYAQISITSPYYMYTAYEIYFTSNKMTTFKKANNTGKWVQFRALKEGLSELTAAEIKELIKSWYDAGDPMHVVYYLATPVTEQYEPQSIFGVCGTTVVTQDPIDLKADLEAYMMIK